MALPGFPVCIAHLFFQLLEHHLDIPHILFDYHMEVKSGSAKNLAKLKSKCHTYVEKFNFFTRKGHGVTRSVLIMLKKMKTVA